MDRSQIRKQARRSGWGCIASTLSIYPLLVAAACADGALVTVFLLAAFAAAVTARVTWTRWRDARRSDAIAGIFERADFGTPLVGSWLERVLGIQSAYIRGLPMVALVIAYLLWR